MKTLFSIAFVALAAVAVSASGAHADNVAGTCNSIVGNVIGAAQQCLNFECFPEDPECADLGAAFLRFFDAPGCVEVLANGELEGLLGDAATQPGGPNAGAAKQIAEVGCGAIVDCGFCGAALALGICGGFCL